MENPGFKGEIAGLLPADYRRQAVLLTCAARSFVMAEVDMRKLDMLLEEMAMLSALDPDPDETVAGNRDGLSDEIRLERDILMATYCPFFIAANRIFARTHGVRLPMDSIREIELEVFSFRDRLKLVEERIMVCDGRLERLVAEAGLLEIFYGHWLSKIDILGQRDENVRAWVGRNVPRPSDNGLGVAELYAATRDYGRNVRVDNEMTASYCGAMRMLAGATVNDAYDILVFMYCAVSRDTGADEIAGKFIGTVSDIQERAEESFYLAEKFADSRMLEKLITSRDTMFAALDDYLQLA